MSHQLGNAIFARRDFFRRTHARTGVALGSVAAASLLGQLATPAAHVAAAAAGQGHHPYFFLGALGALGG